MQLLLVIYANLQNSVMFLCKGFAWFYTQDSRTFTQDSLRFRETSRFGNFNARFYQDV